MNNASHFVSWRLWYTQLKMQNKFWGTTDIITINWPDMEVNFTRSVNFSKAVTAPHRRSSSVDNRQQSSYSFVLNSARSCTWWLCPKWHDIWSAGLLWTLFVCWIIFIYSHPQNHFSQPFRLENCVPQSGLEVDLIITLYYMVALVKLLSVSYNHKTPTSLLTL